MSTYFLFLLVWSVSSIKRSTENRVRALDLVQHSFLFFKRDLSKHEKYIIISREKKIGSLSLSLHLSLSLSLSPSQKDFRPSVRPEMTASPDGGVTFHRRSRRGKDARETASLPV